MAAETQYTANTGMATISTANSNLDGTGTLGTVLTGASNGTLIKTISIKAQTNTSEGMVRLFLDDGSAKKLLMEVEIPAVTKASFSPAFETRLAVNFTLKSGWILKASTEIGDTFNVIAEGQDWTYYAPSVRAETTKYTVNTSLTNISTANSNLDGTGTLGTLITAASNGTNIQNIVIKSQVTTTIGMVRIYVHDGSLVTKLLTEIAVPAITKSGTAHSFSHKIDFGENSFALKAGWKLKASTDKSDSFNVIVEGLDWSY